MSILSYIIACLVGGALWRIGGSKLNVPLKEKWRDIGVPLCGVGYLVALLPITSLWWHSVMLVGFIGLSWATIAESCDHWGTDDIEWYERALSGFLQGLAALPIALYTHRWVGFIIRVIILTIFMPLSNKLQFKVLWDPTDGVEGSRGFVFTATLPLLLL